MRRRLVLRERFSIQGLGPGIRHRPRGRQGGARARLSLLGWRRTRAATSRPWSEQLTSTSAGQQGDGARRKSDAVSRGLARSFAFVCVRSGGSAFRKTGVQGGNRMSSGGSPKARGVRGALQVTTGCFRICLGLPRLPAPRPRSAGSFDDAGIRESTDLYGRHGTWAERSEDLALFDRALGAATWISERLHPLRDRRHDRRRHRRDARHPLGTCMRLRLAREAFKRSVLRQSAAVAPSRGASHE